MQSNRNELKSSCVFISILILNAFEYSKIVVRIQLFLFYWQTAMDVCLLDIYNRQLPV